MGPVLCVQQGTHTVLWGQQAVGPLAGIPRRAGAEAVVTDGPGRVGPLEPRVWGKSLAR